MLAHETTPGCPGGLTLLANAYLMMARMPHGSPGFSVNGEGQHSSTPLTGILGAYMAAGGAMRRVPGRSRLTCSVLLSCPTHNQGTVGLIMFSTLEVSVDQGWPALDCAVVIGL
jgi:hypothetical protein